MTVADEFFAAPPAADDEASDAAPVNPAIRKAHEDLALLSVSRTEKKLGGEALDDLLAEPDEPVDWLFRGLLTRGAVGLIGAEAKGTKTWVGCELLAALSSGTPAFGRFNVPRRGWSLACFLEDGRRNLKSRMRALKAGRNGPCDLSRIRFEARPKINLQSADDRAWIVASARAVEDAAGEPIGLIYIDPLRNAHGAEENSSSEMQPIMDALARIRDVMKGANILVPHHMGRPSKEKQGQRLAHRLRGSTAIFGSVDAAILIETKRYMRAGDSVNWKNVVDVELRDLTPAPPFGLELDVRIDDGAAKVAGWAHHEDPKAMTETEGGEESTEDEIVKVLTGELRGDRNAGRTPRTWSGVYVGECVGVSRATAQRFMDKLTKAGRLIRIGRQWRAIDEIDEDDGED